MNEQAQARDRVTAVSALVMRKLENNKPDVPMLPEVANKVVQLSNDEDSTAARLAALIQGDQSLAGHVIRVANSAAYSPASSIVSLQQAITRLGMQTISEIALAACVNASLFNAPGFEQHIHQRLQHSLATGLWAKEIARACRKNVEAAFLGGLLQDIGRPVTVQLAASIARRADIKLTPEDMAVLEVQFCRQLSIAVVDAWDMPASVREVVRYFDRYNEPHSARSQTIIAVGGGVIANALANEEYDLEKIAAAPVFAELNLYQDEVAALLEKRDLIASTLESMRP